MKAQSRRIFISYRREDTAAAAGRFYDRLWRVLGRPNVFFDIDSIRGGEDFADRIISEIRRADVMLVFIGRFWISPDPATGAGRLFDPYDYVHTEVRAAVENSILILPILVDGARMPTASAIPEDIHSILTRNAMQLRHETFNIDADEIIRYLIPAGKHIRLDKKKKNWVLALSYQVSGALCAVLALFGFSIIHMLIKGRALSASLGADRTTAILLLSPLIGAVLGYVAFIRREGGLRFRN